VAREALAFLYDDELDRIPASREFKGTHGYPHAT
jgi:hypothetical protein